MSVEWIEHKGRRILRVDLSGLRDDQVVETVELEAKMIAESPTKVLILANVEGASIATLEQVKRLGKDTIGPKTLKSAVLGITGLKGILLRAYNTFAGSSSRPFETESEALKWLVE
jgi:hypothetical protein